MHPIRIHTSRYIKYYPAPDWDDSCISRHWKNTRINVKTENPNRLLMIFVRTVTLGQTIDKSRTDSLQTASFITDNAVFSIITANYIIETDSKKLI